MRLAVAGGTGVVGEHVVRLARAAGHDVLVLTRSEGVDLVSGTGLNLEGVDTVIDVSGPNTLSAKKSKRFFTAVTENLMTAERAAGVRHHVALSIVGATQSPYGYYAGKAAQERLIAEDDIPWTILRATQFFEFAEQRSVSVAKFTIVPRLLAQPVAAASVAERLVAIVEGEPQERAIDFAGPSRIRMAELLRAVFEARGATQGVFEVAIPGSIGRAFRSGAMLADANAELDTLTFGEWIAAQQS